MIWRDLAPSAPIWRHLASPGVIRRHLPKSGVIWPHLASSGVIWFRGMEFGEKFDENFAINFCIKVLTVLGLLGPRLARDPFGGGQRRGLTPGPGKRLGQPMGPPELQIVL